MKAVASITIFVALGWLVVDLPFRFGGVLLEQHYVACLIGTIALTLASAVLKGRTQIPWQFLPIACLAIIGLAQTLRSGNVVDTISHELTRIESAKLVSACVIATLGANLLRRPGAVRLLLWAIASTGAVVALVGVMQDPIDWEQTWGATIGPKSQPFGPFINPNNAGAFLALAVACSAGLVLDKSSHKNGADDGSTALPTLGFAIALGLVSYLGAWSTGSRSAAGAATIAVVVEIAAVFSVGVQRTRARAAFIGLLLFGLSAVVWLPTRWVAVTRYRVDSIFSESRFEHWWVMMQSMPESWVTGNGLGTYALLSRRFDVSPSGDVYEHADGQWFELLVEAGTLGLVLGACFVVASTAVAIRNRSSPAGLVSLGTLAALSFHSLFDYAILLSSLYVPVSLLLGGTAVRPVTDRPNSLPVVLLIASGCWATAILGGASKTESIVREFQKLIRSERPTKGELELSIEALQSHSASRPHDGDLLFAIGQANYAYFVSELARSDIDSTLARLADPVQPNKLDPLALRRRFLAMTLQDRTSIRQHQLFQEFLIPSYTAFAQAGANEPLRVMPRVWALALQGIVSEEPTADVATAALEIAATAPFHCAAQRALFQLGRQIDDENVMTATAQNLLTATDVDDIAIIEQASQTLPVATIANTLIPDRFDILLRVAESATSGSQDPLRQAISQRIATQSRLRIADSNGDEAVEQAIRTATAEWLNGEATIASVEKKVGSYPEHAQLRRILARVLAEAQRYKDVMVELKVVGAIDELTAADRKLFAECERSLQQLSSQF